VDRGKGRGFSTMIQAKKHVFEMHIMMPLWEIFLFINSLLNLVGKLFFDQLHFCVAKVIIAMQYNFSLFVRRSSPKDPT
jgi:hypothetical protein